jgi:predicted nucleotidyltransferase
MASTPGTVALPQNVDRVLADFLNAAKTAFKVRLESVVLIGSAAEGRLRPPQM